MTVRGHLTVTDCYVSMSRAIFMCYPLYYVYSEVMDTQLHSTRHHQHTILHFTRCKSETNLRQMMAISPSPKPPSPSHPR